VADAGCRQDGNVKAAKPCDVNISWLSLFEIIPLSDNIPGKNIVDYLY
jgi:hypothetical protein